MSKDDPRKNPLWGKASAVDPSRLFDPKSFLTHSFAGELYERRQVEIDEVAKRDGFVMSTKTKHMVSFVRKDGLTTPTGAPHVQA